MTDEDVFQKIAIHLCNPVTANQPYKLPDDAGIEDWYEKMSNGRRLPALEIWEGIKPRVRYAAIREEVEWNIRRIRLNGVISLIP